MQKEVFASDYAAPEALKSRRTHITVADLGARGMRRAAMSMARKTPAGGAERCGAASGAGRPRLTWTPDPPCSPDLHRHLLSVSSVGVAVSSPRQRARGLSAPASQSRFRPRVWASVRRATSHCRGAFHRRSLWGVAAAVLLALAMRIPFVGVPVYPRRGWLSVGR
jgi:hypothetical protein